MPEQIRMVFADCEAMVAGFKNGGEQLQDVLTELQNIANLLADGGLVGDAGTAFVDLIRNQMSPSTTRLIAKFNEIADDLQKTIDMTRETEGTIESDMG